MPPNNPPVEAPPNKLGADVAAVVGANVPEGVPGFDAPKLPKLNWAPAPPNGCCCGVMLVPLAVPNNVFPGPEVVVFASPPSVPPALLDGVDELPKPNPVLPEPPPNSPPDAPDVPKSDDPVAPELDAPEVVWPKLKAMFGRLHGMGRTRASQKGEIVNRDALWRLIAPKH